MISGFVECPPSRKTYSWPFWRKAYFRNFPRIVADQSYAEENFHDESAHSPKISSNILVSGWLLAVFEGSARC